MHEWLSQDRQEVSKRLPLPLGKCHLIFEIRSWEQFDFTSREGSPQLRGHFALFPTPGPLCLTSLPPVTPGLIHDWEVYPNRPNWLIGNPISWFLIHFFCAALWRQRRLPHTACEEQDSLQPRLWGLLCRQMCMYSLYWSPGKVACLEAVLPRPAAVMKIKPQSTTS